MMITNYMDVLNNAMKQTIPVEAMKRRCRARGGASAVARRRAAVDNFPLRQHVSLLQFRHVFIRRSWRILFFNPNLFYL